MSARRVAASVWAVSHLALIALVCLRDTTDSVARFPTWLPPALTHAAPAVRAGSSALLGEQLDDRNPLGDAVRIYLHASGSETGYGYFAPNVPDPYRVVFDLCDVNGECETVRPSPGGSAAELRVGGLIDYIAATEIEPLRQFELRVICAGVLQQYPEAVLIRATIERGRLPAREESYAATGIAYEGIYTASYTADELYRLRQ